MLIKLSMLFAVLATIELWIACFTVDRQESITLGWVGLAAFAVSMAVATIYGLRSSNDHAG